MKSAENLKNFKVMIKQWNGPECIIPVALHSSLIDVVECKICSNLLI